MHGDLAGAAVHAVGHVQLAVLLLSQCADRVPEQCEPVPADRGQNGQHSGPVQVSVDYDN